MISITVRRILCCSLLASLAACGGGAGDGSSQLTSTPQSANMAVVVSDASSEDWALIGVKLLSIALVPQDGGPVVTVYSAPSPAPFLNLVELDQLGEILGNVMVPVGTYSSATLTIAANPGDIALTAAADPEVGFAATPGQSIPTSAIQIQGATGVSPNMTVPIKVSFQTPLVVSNTQSNALDLEFDLAHPAFIVGHTPPGAGTTLWAVNFNGPVRHHPVADIAHLVLRHLYGTVSTIATDGSSITVQKDVAAIPVTNPETAVSTGASVPANVDSVNGTLFYDLDAKTSTTIKSFASEASNLQGKYVRIAARYQQDGTLIAVRVWASSQFNSVWISPEGHVLHVDSTSSTFVVSNESGVAVPVSVDANTEFFFRQPADASADATPIGTGPSFLTSHDLVRGFKVHVSVVDPLATPLTAQSVDIETAVYDGQISNANTSSFTYTHNFRTAADDYAVTLNYISSGTPNGKDSSGNAVMGFKWWDFAYPSNPTTGSNAVGDFVAATGSSATLGGTVGASYAIWNDPASPSAWSLPLAVLLPTPLPVSTVATGFASGTFTMNVPNMVAAVSVDVGTTSGSATLVYQVDRTNGVVSVSPVDVTTASGMTTLTSGLVAGAPVKVFGIPQVDGTLRAYVLLYYTGDLPL